MRKPIITFICIFVVLMSAVGCAPPNTKQLSDIQAQIQSLKAEIAALEQKLASAKLALSGANYQNNPGQKSVNNYGITSSTNTGLPEIVSFRANPQVITSGQTSNLIWNVNNANAISIDQGIGIPASPFGQPVTPAFTTTYTLTAANTYGSVTSTATVTVNPAPPVIQIVQVSPTITSFTASPTAIYPGGSSTLQWNVSGATAISISAIGSVSYIGSQVVYPASTTTYILTAVNSYQSVTSSVTVIVNPYPQYNYYNGYPYNRYYQHPYPYSPPRPPGPPHPPFTINGTPPGPPPPWPPPPHP
jgi:hypothetical protein